ncbi:Hypothetical predicted protein [Paramuricea clavata]|uniref:Uncharacterized protein n=1 Tax=Paramuricea clavata TaxID=317549 RepID=A0A7D9DY55_PARCT|nr:Hypothetical predicted protein [Paramuricea clavata]
MSRLGSWVDHIIIQAVANANNLRIHITESAQNFTESTVITPIYAQGNVRDMYIGHLDELHYVSTTPVEQFASEQIGNQIATNINRNQTHKIHNLIVTKVSRTVSMKYFQKRKEYMKEYMKKRKSNNEFKKKKAREEKKESFKTATVTYRQSNPEKVKENCKAAIATYRQSNPEKVKESNQTATATYRQSNPEKVKESFKTATATYRQSNAEKVKENFKAATATYRQSNPEKVKESNKTATATYRQSNPEMVQESNKTATVTYRKLNLKKVAELSKLSSITYQQSYLERVKDTQKRQYIKRKLDCSENGTKMIKYKKVEDNPNGNSCEAGQIPGNTDDSRQQIDVTKATELLHKNISVGPEYICTCCDQLWYRSSVTERNVSYVNLVQTKSFTYVLMV